MRLCIFRFTPRLIGDHPRRHGPLLLTCHSPVTVTVTSTIAVSENSTEARIRGACRINNTVQRPVPRPRLDLHPVSCLLYRMSASQNQQQLSPVVESRRCGRRCKASILVDHHLQLQLQLASRCSTCSPCYRRSWTLEPVSRCLDTLVYSPLSTLHYSCLDTIPGLVIVSPPQFPSQLLRIESLTQGPAPPCYRVRKIKEALPSSPARTKILSKPSPLLHPHSAPAH